MSWIKTDVNPQRISNGLKIISEDEATRCFDILEKFHDKMHQEATR